MSAPTRPHTDACTDIEIGAESLDFLRRVCSRRAPYWCAIRCSTTSAILLGVVKSLRSTPHSPALVHRRRCVYQHADEKGTTGVALDRNLVHVAGRALQVCFLLLCVAHRVPETPQKNKKGYTLMNSPQLDGVLLRPALSLQMQRRRLEAAPPCVNAAAGRTRSTAGTVIDLS